MADPRRSLNPATHSVGFTAKLVTVRSVSEDGKTAMCVDRQNVQTAVPMLVQRSKGPLPAAGETWLITQDLGLWLFAAIVATSSGQFLGGDGSSPGGTRVTISATAPASPATGDIWVNGASGNAVFWWNGTSWISAQFGTQAIADGAITRAKVARGALTTAELAPDAGITAGQVAFSVTEIGGVRIFTGTSQPPDPAPGDLWINPGQDNAFYFWDSGKWTGLLFGAGAIEPASLTTFHLTPDAGITDGQVDFTARDIGGVTTSVSSVQPASPAIGDLWFDGTSSYVLRQWDGTTWAPYQFGTQAIQALSVTAALIAANTITAAQIAAGTITATQIAAGTILASNIAAGTITAAQIQAGSLTATVIGNLGACLNRNPFFAGGSLTGWSVGGAGNTASVVSGGAIPAGAPYGNSSTSYAAQLTVTAGGGGNKLFANNDTFGVIVGNRYVAVVWLNSPTAVSVEVALEFRNAGTLVGGGTLGSTVALAANTWTPVPIVVTAPASSQTGDIAIIPQAAATVYVQGAQAFPQIPGIVDATTITGAVINGGIFNGTNWTENSSGSFFYGGAPAAGNLFVSIAPTGGVDGLGNNYGGGVFAYGSSTVSAINNFAAIQGGDFLIQNGSFPYLVTVDGTSGMFSIGVPHGGVQAFFDGAFWIAQQPGTSGPETWHVIGAGGQPAFGAGFAAAGGEQAPRFRFELLGGGMVRLDGVVATTGATLANATMFTLPVDYRPAARKRFEGVSSSSGYVGGNPGASLVQVSTAGVVTCVPACSGAGQEIILEGMIFPVD